MNNRLVAVIDCSTPRDEKGRPRYLRKVCGESLVEIMNRRLRRVQEVRDIILIMAGFDAETAQVCKRLGWIVTQRSRVTAADLAIVLRLARNRYVARFDLEKPFVEPSYGSELLKAFMASGFRAARITGDSDYCPRFIVKRWATVWGVIRRAYQRVVASGRQNGSSERFSGYLEIPALHKEIGITIDAGVDEKVLEQIGGVDFGVEEIRRLESCPEEPRRVLRAAMETSDEPHLMNRKLNDMECEHQCEEVMSFPPSISLNMASVCNARCVFCSYHPPTQKKRDFVTLDDLKKMTWLRYVSEFAIWCGIGDSLVNPEFLDCYRYIKESFPHLEVTLSTNGIRMSEQLCEEFAGHLARYNLSLNAATRKTWERLVRSKGFDNACRTFERLSRLKRDRNLDRPKMVISAILTQENISEAVSMVELSTGIGADLLTLEHAITTTLVGRRAMDDGQSLYFDRERCDEVLDRAAARAEELGLAISRPLPFRETGHQIMHGTRVSFDPPECLNSWKTCYLGVDEEGIRQLLFCSLGYYQEVHYDKCDLHEEAFQRIWNHPAIRYFRRTVNKKGINPICGFCGTEDRFEPGNRRYYEMGRRVVPVFKDLNCRFLAGDSDPQVALPDAR